ncbi:isopeptide-forming domain-containing fimbrial protein [uncultured Faecalibaculum sp.]|uniref:isopeptide-forming domain-containing fimbrial protein n=1 Tax=uncultured Faecalibaculum sp. TaxID=1729681 RepID=UPI002607B8C4|nr:isopeptide-forming domain-containing fimbrial protein [uncultured Faecalibaculum sp.]
MKTNKLIAAGAMALSMAMTPVASLINAMPIAAETVKNSTDHVYMAYQIFSGTQADDETGGILGQVVWGNAVDETKIKTALTADQDFKDTDGDASKVAAKLANDNQLADKFAKIAAANLKSDATATEIAADAESVDLTAGYYLLVDQTVTANQDDVKGLSLLQVTKKGDIEITKKNDKPTVDKKVQDEKNESGADVTEQDSEFYYNADHAIGEEFKFQLTGTVPANTMDKYNTYKFQFNDTLSSGVDFVFEEGGETLKGLTILVNGKDKTADFTSTVSGKILTVSINDLKTLVTTPAEETTVVVTYTAKLNSSALITEINDTTLKNNNKVNLQYSNNPNAGGEGETGKTPDTTVFVGTYKLPNNKVDQDNKPLAGAKFKLQRGTGESAEYAVISNGKVTGWNTTGTEFVSSETGDFSVSGLDAGSYVLIETVAPAGYNKAEPTVVVLNADHNPSTTDKTNNEKVTVTLKVKGEDADEVTIMNNKGGSLPETGGMGTTLIYGAGALMVAGAAVVYVTNKRTRKD